jgi:ribokinase
MDKAATDKIDIAVIGDALIDYQYWVAKMPPVGGDEMISMSNKSTGGSAANSAIALGMLSVRTSFCGRIGSDDNGRWIQDKMIKAGVDISAMQYGESTGYVLSIIDKNSERTMLSFRGASAEPLKLTFGLQQILQKCRILLLSGYCLMNDAQAELSLAAVLEVKHAGGLVALDPSPVIGQISPSILEKLFEATDIKAITDKDDTQEGIEFLLQKISCIALKQGAEGATAAIQEGFRSPMCAAFTEKMICRVPAIKTTAIDTTGAGDAFNAGFIAGMLQSADPRVWLEKGNQLAAVVVAKKGASL